MGEVKRFCASCGATLKAPFKFCSQCGTAVAASTPAPKNHPNTRAEDSFFGVADESLERRNKTAHDWESEPRSGTQNQLTAPRIAALLCVAGFFLPWTGFAGHTASGYDILSTAFDLDQYTRGLVFGALPLLALLSAITDKRGLHIATGCYAVCLLGFGIMENTEVAQSLLRDPETAFKFLKIGAPLTYGGAVAQLLMRNRARDAPAYY